MFEDTILKEDNVILKSLGNSEDYFNLRPILFDKLDQALSKDSDVFRYNFSRLNGMVPERPAQFSAEFPRKSSNLDTDLHHMSFDVDILTRWISRDTLKIFLPVIYFQDLHKERTEKRAAALTAKPVPTTEELVLCSKLRGKGYWNRRGVWFCTTKNVSQLQDEHGKKCFGSYGEWMIWDTGIEDGISEARLRDDGEAVKMLRQARYVRWQ